MQAFVASFGEPISIGRIAGIPLYLKRSWFLIFGLVVVMLGTGTFPTYFPAASSFEHWVAATVAALLFFVSILVHELAHSLVALRAGIGVRSITLFLLGGVSQLDAEASRPRDMVRIAVAGPFASFAIGFGCLALALALAGSGSGPSLASVALVYLAQVNVAVAVFNLIPAFPLDGGHVLRGLWWWWTGSEIRASAAALGAGRLFAAVLVAGGAASAFFAGNAGSLWLVVLGVYLGGAARGASQQLGRRRALERLSVGDALCGEEGSVTVLAEESLASAERRLAAEAAGVLPVLHGGEVVGLLHADDLAREPREGRELRQVWEVLRPLTERERIAPQESTFDALQKMARHDLGGLLVVRGQRLLGVVTPSSLSDCAEAAGVAGT